MGCFDFRLDLYLTLRTSFTLSLFFTLQTFTGERLRQTMDWALSSVGDDVTMYTDKLSQMERRLFSSGAMSAANHFSWKTQGNRRLVQKAPKPRNTAAENAQKARAVSPENEGEQQGRNKRSRTN